MSIQILDDIDRILTVEITGTLGDEELFEAQKQAAAILKEWGGGSLLVLTDGFEGWEAHGKWGSAAFQQEADPLIRKMAVVGEKKWEDQALMFAGGAVRPFPVRYFSSGKMLEARAWLIGNETV